METLARIGLFRSLSAPSIQRLDTQCIWRRVPAKEWIIDYLDDGNDVYAYFNNDYEGHAVEDAAWLRDKVTDAGTQQGRALG